MNSWSGTVRTGPSKWFGLFVSSISTVHFPSGREGPCRLLTPCQRHKPKISSVSHVQEASRPTVRERRPARRVHFATAELRPNFGSDSSEDDDDSGRHVSLLPSRSHDEDSQDGGNKRSKWWNDESYLTAMAMPIF